MYYAMLCVYMQYRIYVRTSCRAKFSQNRWQQRSGSLCVAMRTREGKERTRSIGTAGREEKERENRIYSMIVKDVLLKHGTNFRETYH